MIVAAPRGCQRTRRRSPETWIQGGTGGGNVSAASPHRDVADDRRTSWSASSWSSLPGLAARTASPVPASFETRGLRPLEHPRAALRAATAFRRRRGSCRSARAAASGSASRSRAWGPRAPAAAAGCPPSPWRCGRSRPRSRGRRAAPRRAGSGRPSSGASAFITMSETSRGIWLFLSFGGVQRPWAIRRSIWAGLGLKYGRTPGQHLVQHDADRVDVGGQHGAALERLRGHVGRAADHGRRVRPLEEARGAEVRDLADAALGDRARSPVAGRGAGSGPRGRARRPSGSGPRS